MNDLRYFRNDKLDLVNKEKQRFGFRKLSSGKIASVLLGVTIFGSFALNGQVVKADTPTDGSQKSAVVDEAKSTQNNKEQGVTATFNEEQSGQDTSAKNDGSGEESHEAQTRTVTPGTTSGSEAETGKTKADSTGTDSDKNGAGAAKVRALVLAQMPKADQLTAQEQPTAQKQLTAQELVDKYKSNNLDLEHAQEFLDYYNNLNSITKILDLKATAYGSEWIERVLSGGVPTGVNNDFVKRLVSTNSEQMVKDTQAKIDERIKNLQDLSSRYPNNQKIKDAINKLTDIKDSVTASNITNAKAMENAIDTLDHYGSDDAYKKLAKNAENPPVNKDALQSAVKEADTVKAANSQASEDKQKAYQDAIAAGQTVFNDGKASQAEVNTALSKIEQAKKDLTVSAIQTAVAEASDTQGKPDYYNASDEAKKAYDEALNKAKSVLAEPNATQDQLDAAKKALADAKTALNGKTTDKDALQSAVKEADTVKAANSQASEDKQKAYQDAIAAGQTVFNDGKASQAEVNTALSKIEQAKKDLTVSAIQTAVAEASDTQGKPDYYNASDEAKKAYDEALNKAKSVLAEPNATQDQLDAAKKALADAKTALNGKTTDKDALQSAVKEADTVKAANSQASEDKQKAYQDAIAAGQTVFNDGKASQAEVNTALSKIEQAKKDLTVSAIQTAVAEASDTQGKPDYYNASDEAKKAYDEALNKAKSVLAEPNATQDQLDAAKKALADAKTALNGKTTDKDALQSAVKEADTVKAANSQASEDKQKAYQDAIAAGQTVFNDGKASQAEVNTALSKIEQAKKDLTVSAIQTAVAEASDTQGKPDYYNASDEAKKAYDEALNKAKSVLAEPNATQDQLDAAKKALADAKTALNGKTTDKDALQSAVKEADTVKAANSQASEDKQKAYQDAIAAGQTVFNDGKASQAEVNTALSKIEQAKKDLTVSAIQTAVAEASDTQGKPDYYNASDEAKKAYDEALNKAKSVLAEPNATQDQLDAAKKALADAKTALNGKTTDKDALQSAVKEADTVKAANSQASEDKQKAYQDAIAAGQTVFNDGKASQAEVNTALSKIEQAKKDLTVSAIQTAVAEASDTQGKPDYYNASDEAKKAYDEALNKAKSVLAEPNATQDQLDAAKKALADAKTALNGKTTDKDALQSAVKEADTVKAANSQASEDKQKAYQDAIAAGQTVFNDGKASQAEVNTALSKIEQAKKDLTVSAIQTAVAEASDTQGKPDYYNASDEAKKAYDEALNKAKSVLAEPNATQDQLDAAKKALADAKTALNGKTTDKDALQSAVKEADTVKAANSQASEDKQKAYQDAIAAGQTVFNDGKASQAEVNTALSKIEQAKKDLTVSAIQTAVAEASDTQGKPDYYNASDEAKKAYDEALNKAKSVLAEPNATQDQLDAAKKALADAKTALNGKTTDKDALQSAVKEADTVKAANSQASEDKQKAYQDAIAAGQTVFNDGKASQAEVNTALSKIEQAKKDLTVSAIQTAVAEASDTQGKPDYYNASDEAKKAYDEALNKAKSVLAEPNATQDQLDAAKKALADAKTALNGKTTDKDALQSAVKEADTVKAANSQASEDKQKAYQDAIAAGQTVFNDGKASQAEVNTALSKIEQAKKDLTVSAIQTAVAEASDTQGKPDYYNASDEAKKAYDEALNTAKSVLAEPNATQDQLDAAKKALADAKTALNGKTTDKDALQSAVDAANTTKLDDKYYNASQDKKQAYDEALAQATKLLNDKNASQKAVAEAVANLD